MMLEFLETGKGLYVLAAVCALGIIGRLVAKSLYKRLMKETDNMTLTKNRYLRDLKQKTENTYRLNQGINNSRVYLEKQLSAYRFLGMTLSGWGCFGGQMTILCFLLGGAASFGAYWYRCDSYYIVLYGSVGILAGLGTMVVDYWANLTERRQQLLNALQDYMENSLFNRLVRETSAALEDSRRGAGAGRDSVRGLDRRSRTERRNSTDQDETDGEPQRGLTDRSERADRSGRTDLSELEELDEEDRDFIGQDLESLGRARFVSYSGGLERQGRAGGEERTAAAERAERDGDGKERSQRRGIAAAKKKQPVSEADLPRRDAEYLKTSLEQIAATRERGKSDGEWIKDLSPDELELMGQILKQYLV